MQSRDGGHDADPRSGRPSSHTPIRAKRPTPDSRALPPSRNEAIRDRPNRQLGRNETIRPHLGTWSRTLQDRPPNRETLSDRPTLLTVPQRAADHPEQTAERSKHDSQTSHEDDDTRVNDKPLHREAEEAGAGVTTTRKPMLRAHTARIVERARKRNTVAKTHFHSNLSS